MRGCSAVTRSSRDGEPLPRYAGGSCPAHFRGDPVWGWFAPLIITLSPAVLQFWSLTTPHKITFDETYYAKDAYSLLVKHYAANFVNDGNDDNGNEADKIINSGLDRRTSSRRARARSCIPRSASG